ncbi:hypothetical protein K474DRAFT_1712831 [Panus rudis PR-1116 ss-1]|nr:hypothetical protein K474DRAFT_1712831 [Panus rudis PR-1116 ss-1]
MLNINVVSTGTSTPSSGTITMKLGFEHPQAYLMEFRIPLVSVPPTEGIGTVRSNAGRSELEDDGLSPDDEDSNTDDENAEQHAPSPTRLYRPPSTSPVVQTLPAIAVPAPEVAVQSPSHVFSRRAASSRSNSVDSTAVSSGAITPSTCEASFSGTSSPSTPLASLSGTTIPLSRPQTGKENKKEKAKFRKSWAAKSTGFNYLASKNDILGIVMLEIQGAKDLPNWRNLTRTGWEMDLFVVISFGKKVFRTRVIQFTVLDWDKLSSNDHVGDAYLGDWAAACECATEEP